MDIKFTNILDDKDFVGDFQYLSIVYTDLFGLTNSHQGWSQLMSKVVVDIELFRPEVIATLSSRWYGAGIAIARAHLTQNIDPESYPEFEEIFEGLLVESEEALCDAQFCSAYIYLALARNLRCIEFGEVRFQEDDLDPSDPDYWDAATFASFAVANGSPWESSYNHAVGKAFWISFNLSALKFFE